MKSSCIQHPTNEPLVMLRKWQVEACEDNHCAAALLSFFEYWHNIKIEMAGQVHHEQAVAENHGDDPPADPTLLQWHTGQALIDGLLSLYGKTKINQSIKLLESVGFISVHTNPNPRYAFDKTRHFEFHPSAVNDWLFSYNAVAVSGQRLDRSSQRLTESDRTSPESSSEITSEKRKDTERAREEFTDQGQKGQEDADLASLRQAALDTLDEAEARRDEYVRRGEEEKLCPACNEPEGLGHVAGCEYGIATKGEATDAQRGLQRLAGTRPVHAPADRASLLHDRGPEIVPPDRSPPRGLAPVDTGGAPSLDEMHTLSCQQFDGLFPCKHETQALMVLADILGRTPSKSHRNLHEFVHAHPLSAVVLAATQYVKSYPDQTQWTLGFMFNADKAETMLAAAKAPPPAAPKPPSRPEDVPQRYAAYTVFPKGEPAWVEQAERQQADVILPSPTATEAEAKAAMQSMYATFNMNQAKQDAERHTSAEIAAYLKEEKGEA